MIGEFPNIPRIYTALAEWLACLVIIFPSLTKPIPVKKYGLMLFAGVGQIALQYIAGMLPLFSGCSVWESIFSGCMGLSGFLWKNTQRIPCF